MSAVLGILERAGSLHRRETIDATRQVLDGLLATDRIVRDVRIDAAHGFLLVTIGNVIVRLAVPSGGQARAVHSLWRGGDVTFALGLVLEDGRAMLGFSGPGEDVLVSTRVVRVT